ncbi:hypothetical protein B0J11DRAFT_444774 [Dendryphion nanum]|uniref:FAD-binding PCMH-type domain-containing protein n=1 Tax=Dendryphion nanum TaxID=256645 RepID=A0A9P9D7A3_9PLEO|nr:hypothetical protein B0J11DRAFT_444774 [Dendryphion nanum]
MASTCSLVRVLILSLCLHLVAAALPAPNQVRSELGPNLSPNAAIYDPTSPEFGSSTTRWQQFASPNVSIVVNVHTEDDIVATILYANKHAVPFLATNGGHGTFGSLGGLQNGLLIRLRSMNSITISADGKYATMQGGVSNLDAIQKLDAASKQTVTGACECTGLLGAALGGGHGFQQGRYGLLADNIIDARVVLATGEVVNASASTNTDLYWGLKGAGHNFGIVSEFRYKIYDVAPTDLWYTETLIFAKDQLKAVYTQVNKMMAGTPPPIILLGIIYNGPESEAKKYITPFNDLKPLFASSLVAPHTALPAITGNDMNSEICQNGLNRLKFPVGLQTFDVPTLGKIFDTYSNFTAATPALNGTILLFEGYSNQAVMAVDETTTAFPHRRDKIIATPVISFKPDVSLNEKAIQFGTSVRAMLQSGSKQRELHAYVNYAHGDEELTSLFGYDVWRRTKLRALKKKYDVNNRFNWYAPITFGRWG